MRQARRVKLEALGREEKNLLEEDKADALLSMVHPQQDRTHANE